MTEYVYDNLQRNTQENWKDGATTVRALSYSYDAASQMLAASDPSASYTYAYDQLGRATSISNVIAGLTPNVVLTQAYDAHSQRTQVKAAIGGVNDFRNDYTFDNLGRLTRVQQAGQGGNAVAAKRVDFAYDAAAAPARSLATTTRPGVSWSPPRATPTTTRRG